MQVVAADLHRSAAGRVAASLLCLTLSGAPALAQAFAPAPAHRCRCTHGAAQECACSHCRAAAAAAPRPDGGGPPCHRATAAAVGRRAGAPASPHPRVTSSCGDPEARLATRAPGTEPFVLAAAPTPRGAPPAGRLGTATAVAGRVAPEPETPPPRAAP